MQTAPQQLPSELHLLCFYAHLGQVALIWTLVATTSIIIIVKRAQTAFLCCRGHSCAIAARALSPQQPLRVTLWTEAF